MTYSDQEFTAIMDAYGDMVLRICFVRLGRMADAQDAFQDVFCCSTPPKTSRGSRTSNPG